MRLACAVAALFAVAASAQPYRWYSQEQVDILGLTWLIDSGDVDGDGDLDIAALDMVYINDGGGHFEVRYLVTRQGRTLGVALGDVDGDGDLDLVRARNIVNLQSYPDWLYLNDGTGQFAAAPVSWFPGPQLAHDSCVALFDADGDGDLDCILGQYMATPRLMLNDGTGRFTDATANLPATNYLTLDFAIADFDRDGDLDVLAGNGDYAFPQPNVLYLNRGNGVFDLGSFPAVLTTTMRLASGDVNGDGAVDVYVGNSNQDELYLNDGSGGFTDASHLLPPMQAWAGCVMLADVDGDSDTDLVRGTGAGDFRIFTNEGPAGFVDASARLILDRHRSLHFNDCVYADLDSDGDRDIIAVGSSISYGRWGMMLSNATRHVAAADSPRIGMSTYYQLSGRPGGLMAAGLSTPLAQSIPIPGLGRFGLEPSTFAPLPLIRLPASGTYDWWFRVPNAPVLRGVRLAVQALDVPLQGAPHLTRFTREEVR